MKLATMLDRPEPSRQRWGIEIELEQVTRHTALALWTTKDDGSLRDCGIEFITEPLDTATIFAAIEEFYNAWENNYWKATARTGIHVHMDMLRRTPEEIQAVLACYLCVEPLLFQQCGADREENIYCVPWYRAEQDLEYARDFFARPSIVTLTDLQCTCKYSALYLEPLIRFGTLEFRGAPSFTRREDLENLVRTMLSILNCAHQLGTAERVVAAFDRDPHATLARFFGQSSGAAVELMDDKDSVGIAELLLPSTAMTTWTRVMDEPMAGTAHVQAMAPSLSDRSRTRFLSATRDFERVLEEEPEEAEDDEYDDEEGFDFTEPDLTRVFTDSLEGD